SPARLASLLTHRPSPPVGFSIVTLSHPTSSSTHWRAAMGVMPFVAEDHTSAALTFREHPIDLVHLARTTLGDASIEREMLAAFRQKTSILMLRMQQASHSSISAAAQALKISARSIGAWHVVSAA